MGRWNRLKQDIKTETHEQYQGKYTHNNYNFVDEMNAKLYFYTLLTHEVCL